MEWYYTDNGQQVGPVPDAELDNLVKAGKIKPDTLLWRDGMAEWQPYAQVKSSIATTPAGGSVAGGVECVECKKVFPMGEVIAYENLWVCGGCKATFFQKLKEGARITGTLEYASVPIRWGADILDAIILYVVNFGIGLIVGFALAGSQETALAAQLITMGVGMLIGVAYQTFFVGKFSASPGKMACKIKIVRPDGTPISYQRAMGRAFAEILSSLTIGIGYLMACFDDEKRTLHDRICDTRVIRP
jgi:uncharacterized RDD family membrane protein YckC